MPAKEVAAALDRRDALSVVAAASVAATAGCVLPFSKRAVLVYNDRSDAVAGAVHVANQETERVVLDESFELAAEGSDDDSASYGGVAGNDADHLVTVELDSGLSGDAVWNLSRPSTLSMEVSVLEDEILFSPNIR